MCSLNFRPPPSFLLPFLRFLSFYACIWLLTSFDFIDLPFLFAFFTVFVNSCLILLRFRSHLRSTIYAPSSSASLNSSSLSTVFVLRLLLFHLARFTCSTLPQHHFLCTFSSPFEIWVLFLTWYYSSSSKQLPFTFEVPH